MDFFGWPPFRDRPEEPRLPRSEWKYLASEDEVRSFLEKQCHLSRRAPVPGNEAEQHHDAFNVWGQWVEGGTIIAPFCVVHVDAHSDLGSGWNNRSFTFIETELLALSIEQRRHPTFALEHLNSGNYLLGAIANRWISQLTYVYPADRTEFEPEQPGSLPPFEDDMRELARLLQTDQGPPVNALPAWIFRTHRLRPTNSCPSFESTSTAFSCRAQSISSGIRTVALAFRASAPQPPGRKKPSVRTGDSRRSPLLQEDWTGGGRTV